MCLVKCIIIIIIALIAPDLSMSFNIKRSRFDVGEGFFSSESHEWSDDSQLLHHNLKQSQLPYKLSQLSNPQSSNKALMENNIMLEQKAERTSKPVNKRKSQSNWMALKKWS